MQADKCVNMIEQYRGDSLETLKKLDDRWAAYHGDADATADSSLLTHRGCVDTDSAAILDSPFNANVATLNLPSTKVQPGLLTTLASVINHVNEAIFIINEQGVLQMLNPMAATLFGASIEDLTEQPWSDFLQPEVKERYLSLLAQGANGQETLANMGTKEIVLQRADSLSLDVDLSLSYLPASPTGQGALYMGMMHNLTRHKAQYQALRLQARTDKLTGLANRHAFDEEIERCWVDCNNDHQPLSLVVIDVDYFKLFNDRYGHVNGDACLKKIAAVIDSALPTSQCMAARYGGEEFALILPNCDATAAQLCAQRVQTAINHLSFTDLGLHGSVRVSVSQGIAVETLGQYRTSKALLCAADTALYRAKSDGRNRINIRV